MLPLKTSGAWGFLSDGASGFSPRSTASRALMIAASRLQSVYITNYSGQIYVSTESLPKGKALLV